jgi:hypothetical protein
MTLINMNVHENKKKTRPRLSHERDRDFSHDAPGKRLPKLKFKNGKKKVRMRRRKNVHKKKKNRDQPCEKIWPTKEYGENRGEGQKNENESAMWS